MKSDRISKKTQQRALHTSLHGAVTDVLTCDLSSSFSIEGALLPLADLVQRAVPFEEDIIARTPAFENERDLFTWFSFLSAESPVAGSLLLQATQSGWSVGLAALNNDGYHLDIPKKILLLDCYNMAPVALGRSTYFRNALLFTFIKALRDIDHEEIRGSFEKIYGPEDILMLERIRSADCESVALLAGWELRGAGYSDLWRHLIGSSEGDMALVFSRFLERDPSALFNGAALAHAFRQWFNDDNRVDSCDHGTLEHMDDVLCFSQDHNPFGEETLDAQTIEDITVLPDGLCYLDDLGEDIRRDPFFVGLSDVINQTHLLQIIYDLDVTIAGNVPFQDAALARKFFPQEDSCTIGE